MDLLTEVPGRVLAVYAHPDDPEVACAGTLARWADGGAQVALVVCASGDKGSSAGDVDPVALASARAGEVARAAAALGVERHAILGLPDGEVENDLALRRELVGWVRDWRPDTVIGPDPTAVFFGGGYVNHHDHRSVGWALLDAVFPAAASPLYFPAAGEPHSVAQVLLSGTLQPDTAVDIGAQLDRKAGALRCHASQLGAGAGEDDDAWVAELVQRRAAEAGAAAGVEHAETFRRIQAARVGPPR